MGSYKNKETGKWEWVEQIDGRQIRRRSRKWTTKKMADAHMENFIKEYEAKKQKDKKETSPLFNEISTAYLSHKSLFKKQSTIVRNENTIKKHIDPYFGNIPINEIDIKKITKWQTYLLSKTYLRFGEEVHYSTEYLESVQWLFGSIMKYAVDFEYISSNPFNKTEVARRNEVKRKPRFNILTKEQFDAFLTLVDDPFDRIGFIILYWCGLRPAELAGLDIGDYDYDMRTLHIQHNYDHKNGMLTTTKTGHERIIAVPDICADEIEKLISSYPKLKNMDHYALVGFSTRYPYKTFENHKVEYFCRFNNISIKQWDDHKSGTTIIEDFDLEWFTFKDLRHTHVSTLIDLGWEAKDISDRLGHSVHEVNETYGHLFPKRNKEMFNKLNNLGNEK